MKPKIPKGMKIEFALRLKEALDKKGFPEKGRASRLGEVYGVTTSAAAAWLKGSIPTVDVLLRICEDFGVKPTYLLTGRDDSSFEVDHQRLSASVKLVNHYARQMKVMDQIDDGKLAALYDLIYARLAAGQVPEAEIKTQIQLAVPSEF